MKTNHVKKTRKKLRKVLLCFLIALMLYRPFVTGVYAYFDTRDNVIRETIQDGTVRSTQTFTYDLMNRRISERNALGGITRYTYEVGPMDALRVLRDTGGILINDVTTAARNAVDAIAETVQRCIEGISAWTTIFRRIREADINWTRLGNAIPGMVVSTVAMSTGIAAVLTAIGTSWIFPKAAIVGGTSGVVAFLSGLSLWC